MRTVFISKPTNVPLGQAMSRIRTWLEERKIIPAGFGLAENGRNGFELSFWSETEAAALEEFRWSL